MAPRGNELVSSNDSELEKGKCGQRDHEVDLGHEDRRNSVSEIGDVDIEMQLCYSEAFSDENDCMWLSSSGMPPFFQSSDNPQSADILEVDFFDLLLYYQFSAVSPVFRGDGAFFDVAQRNPVPDESCTNSMEASLILERKESCAADCQNDNFLGGNGIKYSSVGYLEGVEFSDRGSFCEDSSSVDSSLSSSLGTCEEPSSLQEYDLEIINIWLPLLDLEGNEPNWDADAFDGLDQDFPSPSCHRQMSLQTRSSSFSYIQASKQLLHVQASLGSPSTIFNLSPEYVLDVKSSPKDLDVGEPLFWPFDQKSYWSTELEWNYLSISPPGSILNIRRPKRCHASKSVQFRLHQRNNSSLHGKSIQRRPKGRMSFSSIPSQSHHASQESGDPSSRISSDSGVPSGLSRSIGLPSDEAICSLSKNEGIKRHSQSNSPRIRHGVNQKTSLDKYLLESEADDFRIYLTGEIPIETLLGLDEFDGHEGIGTMTVGWSMEDFNEDPLL